MGKREYCKNFKQATQQKVGAVRMHKFCIVLSSQKRLLRFFNTA
jgi:hypothetical protein